MRERNKPNGDAELFATPNPAPADSEVRLTGCGYEAQAVTIRVSRGDVVVSEIAAGVFASGCLEEEGGLGVPIRVGEAGEYVVESFQEQRGNRSNLKASVIVSVV